MFSDKDGKPEVPSLKPCSHKTLCDVKRTHTLFEKSRGRSSRCCGLSSFTYIITHHGLGGFSELINGLIAAAIGALSMLTSELTAKSNVKRTRMFVLSLATLHYITLIFSNFLNRAFKAPLEILE